MSRPNAIVVLSGGMDSVTLFHRLEVDGYEPLPISFNYGQKHKKELGFAEYWANRFGVPFQLVDLSSINGLLQSSALANPNADIPEGHYAAENMKATVVPNRNMIMLSIAAAYAVDQNAEIVATGVHSGDHDIYPDCRPEFINACNTTIIEANEGFINESFHLYTPYIYSRKEDIAAEGHKFGVDWNKTWSCYKGGRLHCGKCGTCVERKEAFEKANITDPTQYEAG